MQTNYQRYQKLTEAQKNAVAIAVAIITSIAIITILYFTTPNTPYNPQIKRVVDGDTVQLENGEYLRLAGIDAPEMHTNDKYQHPDCGAQQATQHLKEITKNENLEIFILPDKGEYGRWIGYIRGEEDKIDINRWLVRQGYAESYYTDRYIRAEQAAARENKGIHRHCKN